MAKLLGVKHLWHVREFGYADYSYRHIGGDFIKRNIFGLSTRIVAISESIYDYIRLPQKTSLIHNGIFYISELAGLNKKGWLALDRKFGYGRCCRCRQKSKKSRDLTQKLGRRKGKRKSTPKFLWKCAQRGLLQ